MECSKVTSSPMFLSGCKRILALQLLHLNVIESRSGEFAEKILILSLTVLLDPATTVSFFCYPLFQITLL